MPVTLQRRFFLSHFLAVLLVSGGIGTFVYQTAIESLRNSVRARLEYSAALLGRMLDADELRDIRGPLDVERPAYRAVLDRLRDFRASNADIAFIYVMRREGATPRVFFVVDSDASPDQALPGKEYLDDVPRLRDGFTGPAADEDVTVDEWGYFLSGYAPLRNGRGEYLVGIDMRADEVERKMQRIRWAGALSLALSLLLAYLFSRGLAHRLSRPIRQLAAGAQAIESGVLGGHVEVPAEQELGELASAFNTMSTRLLASAEAQQSTLAELESARQGLEVRVSERTARLEEGNAELQAEVDERRRAEVALAKAATTDYLTGLFNRRAMVHLLELEAARQPRSKRPYSIILCDVDHFKAVNDHHGHAVGDDALVRLAAVLRENLRGQDAVARWGGEEFLVFLPETRLEGALLVAEKIRAAIGDQPHEVSGHALRLTVSFGVATYRDGMTVTEQVRLADAALYRAKAEGRNRVVEA